MLINGILRVILWLVGVPVTALLRVENGAFKTWERRQPKHAVKDNPNWVSDLPAWDTATDFDWFPQTPKPVNEPCPVCGDDEFPLVTFDNQRMCLVCKDDSIIIDRTFGSTGFLRQVS